MRFGEVIISGRGRQVHHEARGVRQIGRFRADEALEAETPGHDALEVVDELHLAHERQAGTDEGLGEGLPASRRVHRGCVAEPDLDEGVAVDRHRSAAAAAHELRHDADLIQRQAVDADGRARRPEFEDHPVETRLVGGPDGRDLGLRVRIAAGLGRADDG